MPVQIKEVSSRRELKKFVTFPFRLYRNDPYWVPPMISGEMETLSSEKNPSFDHCEARYLLAYREGEIAGRIAGIINHRYNQQWDKKVARFSWFDMVDDPEVSDALLGEIEQWAISKGMEQVVGPMGFTTFEHQGILIMGYDEMPTFAGVHNYPYYATHLERLGYGKEIEYVEYELSVPVEVPDKVKRISQVVKERYGLRLLQPKSTKEMLPYAEQVFHVVNEAYMPLFGFTRLTEKQIQYLIKKYFSVVRPEFTTVVLDSEDRVLGFQISMPSLSRAFQKANGRMFPLGWYYLMRAIRHPVRIDMLLTGILPEYQNKGVNALLMVHLTGAAISHGILHAESNSELEENYKVQSFWKPYDRRQHRRARIYSKRLS
jgi:GNAT superfamily N-acetyltransferase